MQPLHVSLEGLKVNDVDQRNIGDQRGKEGMLDHLDIRDAHILDHQESGRPHYRRHNLSIDR